MQPFYFLSSRSMTSATTRSDHRAKRTTARSSVNNGGRIQLFQNSSHMRRQNAPLFNYAKIRRSWSEIVCSLPSPPLVLPFTTSAQRILEPGRGFKKNKHFVLDLKLFHVLLQLFKTNTSRHFCFCWTEVHDNYKNKKTSLCNQMVTNNSIPGQTFNGFPTI